MRAFHRQAWPTRLSLRSQTGWTISCSGRSLSSIAKMLDEGRLREINIFGSEVSPSEYEAVMEAYSYSHFVHIPVNHLPLNQLDSIRSETLEKMLATSLLCKYRGASISIARAICSRRESPSKMYSYGHCMLAFYADEQWLDIQEYTTASELLDYIQLSTSAELTQNHHFVEVVRAVLKGWIHTNAIDEIGCFLELLLTTSINWESVLIGSRDVLQEILVFLRHHGQHDLSHRLLSLLQHNLQRRIFNFNLGGQSRANSNINDLIAFSMCLFDKEDMKYVTNVYAFYVKNILPSRSSYKSRLNDIENIMASVLSPFQQIERDATLEMISLNKAERALTGYEFYNRLRRQEKYIRSIHKENALYLSSPKIYTQLAMIIGHLNPTDLGRQNRHGGQKRKQIVVHRKRERRLLALLNQLKEDFSAKFSQSSSFQSHAYFYTAYISSLQRILTLYDPESLNYIRDRDWALNDVLRRMRHSGIPFGHSERFSRVVVDLFLTPPSTNAKHDASMPMNADVNLDLKLQEENIQELMLFVTNNSDCFNLDTICKHIISHLSNKTQIDQAIYRIIRNSNHPTPCGNSEHTDIIEAGDLYAKYCATASYSICRFLKSLSASGITEVFQDHCQAQEEEREQDCPVQHYRSFKECSDREWRSIKLLQTSCVQLFNLKHPAVISDLVVVLSSLSTQQLVPYSYWSQAIQLCTEAKKWEDLKVLLQLLLYQGKMIQYSNIQSVLSAYISTHNPHIGYRIVGAMRRGGVAVPAEAYRTLCVALGRLSGRQRDGAEQAAMAESSFQYLMEAYGPIAFTGNFDTSRGANLVRHRTEWVINSQNENMIKAHLKDCERYIAYPEELRRVYEDILAVLPSKYYEAGVFLITTMLSQELCLPKDGDIDRFIDAAIENDRLIFAASMLRTIKHLKENYMLTHFNSDNDNDDGRVDDGDVDRGGETC